jgi:ferredoxin-NADP reductase
MSKPNLHSLSRMDFLKVVPARNEKIQAAPAERLPPLSSYTANRIARALHPDSQSLKVAEVIAHSADVRSFVLVPDPDSETKELAYFSAGQYLSISLTIGGSVLTRPYSLSSSPRESLAGRYMVTVKRTEGGLASHYILDTWAAGTKVLASAPLGDFTHEPLRDARNVIALAGGCGITPFRSLAYAIADGDEDASLTLLYGSKSKADAVFQDEFEKLAARCDRFHLVNVLSDEATDGCETGFITADLIRKYAPEGEYSLFICGPQAMYNFVDKEIAKLNLRPKFVRHEVFGEYRHPTRDAAYPATVKGDSGGFELTVRVRDEEKTVRCTADESLLVAMERNGIAAPARCRGGECGWCHSRLVSGEVYVPASGDGRRVPPLKAFTDTMKRLGLPARGARLNSGRLAG